MFQQLLRVPKDAGNRGRLNSRNRRRNIARAALFQIKECWKSVTIYLNMASDEFQRVA
jgi:hypothetical protein